MDQTAIHYDRLRQRRDWLTQRIQAKLNVGWDVEYDTAERDALTWALQFLPTNDIEAATAANGMELDPLRG